MWQAVWGRPYWEEWEWVPLALVPQLIVMVSRLSCEPSGQRPMPKAAGTSAWPYQPRKGLCLLTVPSPDHVSLGPGIGRCSSCFLGGSRMYEQTRGWVITWGGSAPTDFFGWLLGSRLEFQVLMDISTTCSTGILRSTFPKPDSSLTPFPHIFSSLFCLH